MADELLPVGRQGKSKRLVEIATEEVAEQVALGKDYRGLYPNTYYAEQSGTGTNDNDILFTTADSSMFDTHAFRVTAGTADIEISLDGASWTDSATNPVLVSDAHTQPATPTGATALSNECAAGKVYKLKFRVKKLRLRQKGATAAAVHMASSVGG